MCVVQRLRTLAVLAIVVNKMGHSCTGFNVLLVHYESVIEVLDNLSDESGPAGAKA